MSGICIGALMILRKVTSLLARWWNYLSQLLNVFVFINVRQTEIHTTEPLVSRPSASEIEMAIEELKVTNHQVLIKPQQN
jgi:hypothetical protein